MEEIIKKKFVNIIDKNSGFQTIKTIRYFNRKNSTKISRHQIHSSSDIINMNYAPITYYVDVERCFSQYKSIL